MTNQEAVKWLENLIDDIGQPRGMYLWHYAQALSEIITLLNSGNEAHREDETASDMRDYCERYEPTYNPEDGSM